MPETGGWAQLHVRLAGARVARLLEHSWRPSPDNTDLTAAELEEIAPLLLASGCSGLGWRRVAGSPLAATAAAAELHQAYRLQALESVLHDRALAELPPLWATVPGALLGKGRAVARLYPDPGLRPYGDFDIYVPIRDVDAAERVLAARSEPRASVDLHRGFGLLDDRTPEQLAARSVPLGTDYPSVRVFGEEDHLRLLCLHLLGHGAWRPLWLCDVALAVERRSPAFDWDHFLSGTPVRTDWVLGAVALARDLLGASLDGAPGMVRGHAIPSWLPRAVLRQWGTGQVPHGARTAMRDVVADGKGVLSALLMRWPNPIESTIGRRRPFDAFPRLPVQLHECAARVAGFMRGYQAPFVPSVRGTE